ncbi:pyridoxal phosphate phosphatase PHOSPHO2-like [Saccostrea cucullata]|uniref:pyridoxal phosphate phosphatase PHOSPHO2-like n=1 Tax=Saccostrea cuccullata TaxID=36930 RepID=UPI002ECFE477
MTEKILFAFDFDHTVIDENSDLYCKRLAPDGKIPQEIEDTYSDVGWTKYMGLIFEYLHSHGVTEQHFRECMNEIPLTKGMRELIEYATENKHESIIISDSNSWFIENILNESGLKDAFSEVYTNPAQYDAEGRLTIEFYHKQDWCDLSTVNLCKGHILQEHVRRREQEGIRYKCVVLVGDGSNDFCPALRLTENDYVCPRISYRLWKKIQKLESDQGAVSNGHKLRAQVVNWTSGLDILEFLKSLDG